MKQTLLASVTVLPRIVSADAYYDTATLLEVIYAPQNVPGLSGFWLQFFPQAVYSETEKIFFDEIDLNEYRLAPFVAPNVQGRVVRSKGFSTRSFRPAYVKPKHVVDPSRTITRLAGERLLGTLSRQERYDAIVADNLRRERLMIENRWDWMACQAVVNGSVVVAGDDYPSVTVDFGRDPRLTNVLTGGALWSASTATPMSDIANMRSLAFQLSRAPITKLIFGIDAWNAFLNTNHQDVQNALSVLRRGNESLFNVANVNTGAPFAYQGNIAGLGGVGRMDLFTYANFYEDWDGTAKQYMDQGTVIGVGDAVQGAQCFGAIMDKRGNFNPVSLFPKLWEEEDPSVTYTMTQSAPLMVPVRVNNTFSLKVV